MGKNGRAKWEAKVARARREGAESVSPPRPKKTALVWLRSVSASSICLGGLGLMQTFFWPAIAALYIGVILLIVDLLLLEKFEGARWMKILILCAIIALTAIFTKTVVFRSAPLSVSYRVNDDVLEVYVLNDSTEDDYEGLDIKVKPDFPDDYIASPEQVTHVPGVSFADPMPSAMHGKGESILMTIDTREVNAQPKDIMNNFLRFRCERLPAGTFLKFQMKLVKGVGNHTEPIMHGVQEVSVEGKLRGRFRVFDIDEKGMPFPIPR